LLTVTALLGLGSAIITAGAPTRLREGSFEPAQAICLVRAPLDALTRAQETRAQQTRARRRHWAQQRSTAADPLPAGDPS
jgi:hypothetical protein